MAKVKYPHGRPILQGLTKDSNFKKLKDDFIAVVDGRIYVVPAKYVTDGASYPEALEPIMGDPFAGVTTTASLVHDYLCTVGATYSRLVKEGLPIPDDLQSKLRSQKETHKVFYKLFRHEIGQNKEYSWRALLPWNNKGWQYSRAWLAYKAVVIHNRLKNRNWK